MLLKEYYQSMHGKLNEVDDDQMIKYKTKDGESKEMEADSAKRMSKDHPAKIAYDKLAGGDADDAKKGVNIFDEPDDDTDGPDDGGEGSDDDWDRDPSLEPGDDGRDYAKPGDEDWEDEPDPSDFAGNATSDDEDTMDNLKWGDAEFEPDTYRQAKHWDDESNWSDDNKELRRSIDNSGASYYLKDPTRLQNFKNNPKSAAKLMKDKNWPPEVVQHMKDIGALPGGPPKDTGDDQLFDNPLKMFDDMDIGYEETEDEDGNKKYELEDGRELTFTDKGVVVDDDKNEEIDQWPYPPENWDYETVKGEDGRDLPVVPHDHWMEEAQEYLGRDFPEESLINKRGVAVEGSFRNIQEQWVKNNIS